MLFLVIAKVPAARMHDLMSCATLYRLTCQTCS